MTTPESRLLNIDRLNPARSTLGLALLCSVTATLGGLLLGFGGPLAAAAAVSAVAATLLVLRDVRLGFWGVIAVVCLLPFATLPVKIVLTPTLLDLALGAVVGIWVLQLATGQRRTVMLSPISLPLLVFILIAVFAFIFGLGNGPLTPNLLRHFAELLLSLGFVLVVVDYARTWGHLEQLVRALLWAGAGAGALGIGLWLLPDDLANTLLNALSRLGYPGGFVIRYIEENPALAERAIGTSVDPNAFGGLLVLVGALAGPQLVARRPLLPRWQAALVVGLIYLALLLTFSRGALLALVGALSFVAVVRYRRLLPYLVVGGLLLLFLPVAQVYVTRLVEGFRGEDLATQMRFGEIRDALTLIGRYPIFGVGFAGAPDVDIYLGVANVYLTVAQQMGLVGVVAFLLIFAVLFGDAFLHRHTFKSRPRLDPLWLGLHAAVVGGLITGVFDHYLFNIDFHHAVTAFWLFVGLAAAATRLGRLDAAPDIADTPRTNPTPE